MNDHLSTSNWLGIGPHHIKRSNDYFTRSSVHLMEFNPLLLLYLVLKPPVPTHKPKTKASNSFRHRDGPGMGTHKPKDTLLADKTLLQLGADDCCICMCPPVNPKTLDKCKHTFCAECIDRGFKIKPVCPICGEIYGSIIGNQPIGGTMNVKVESRLNLPGYEGCGTIVIYYNFASGVQTVSPFIAKPYILPLMVIFSIKWQLSLIFTSYFILSVL